MILSAIFAFSSVGRPLRNETRDRPTDSAGLRIPLSNNTQPRRPLFLWDCRVPSQGGAGGRLLLPCDTKSPVLRGTRHPLRQPRKLAEAPRKLLRRNGL